MADEVEQDGLSEDELAALADEMDESTEEPLPKGGAEERVAQVLMELNDDATASELVARVKAGELSVEDLARGFLREGDYTRKTQGAATLRKEAEAKAEEAAAKLAEADERERSLASDNKDLYTWLLQKFKADPTLTVAEVLGEESPMADDDDLGVDDGKVAKRIETAEERLSRLESRGFERDVRRDIDDMLDDVPDLVPSRKATDPTDRAIRDGIVELVLDRYMRSEAARNGEPMKGIAAEVIKVERAKQKRSLERIVEARKERGKQPRREGGATVVTRDPSPLDDLEKLDTMTDQEWQTLIVGEAVRHAEALEAEQ